VRYIVVIESLLFVPHIQDLTGNAEEVICLLKKGSGIPDIPHSNTRTYHYDPCRKETYLKLEVHPDDRVILQADTREKTEEILAALLTVCESVPVVVLSDFATEVPVIQKCTISYLPIKKLLWKDIEKEWLDILNRERTERIRTLTQSAENVLILTQHDPDPDALASGLALRALLGRNRATAPIGSFGKVTRSENLSMIRLLNIRLNMIVPQDLNSFSMIAMVDVQPPYFGDQLSRTDIVFDHHPQPVSYEASFRDIRVKYGATSTILTEYLSANDVKLNQRVATALLYGIKTDTLMLGRNVNAADIEAFTSLYPLANHNLIRRMENPSLNPQDVSSFIKALKKQIVIDKILFVHLGRVTQEDIIPRLADFCLQIEGADWSVISGLFQKNLVISLRNVGYVKSAGDIVRRIFNDSIIAGGHRTMAKAVMPTKAFMKSFGITSTKEIQKKIIELFVKGLKEYSA
jgi:nanoRNase/pAp phosphatase (c-di-AMP/oligoRNAs hydrolase)